MLRCVIILRVNIIKIPSEFAKIFTPKPLDGSAQLMYYLVDTKYERKSVQ